MTQAHNSVTVAPDVLFRLVRAAVCAVPGVARLGAVPRSRTGSLWDGGAGVALSTGADGLIVDCYLVAQSGARLIELGVAVKLAVAAVIREIVGAPLHEVNVAIQDIADPTPAGEPIVHG